MNVNKHYEFFQPDSVKERVHIIGCGAIGSTLAFMLAKLGLTNIVLYDEDMVEGKNVANQMYRSIDIGKPKTEALRDLLVEINPEIESNIELKGFYTDQQLDGYVFMAADSIDVRRKIAECNKFNPNVIAMFDFRMRLEDAQHYAADWSSVKMKDELLASMDFTEEEAQEATPRSACHETLSIFYTITGIVGCGIENFVHFVKDKASMQKMMLYNAKFHAIDTFARDDSMAGSSI